MNQYEIALKDVASRTFELQNRLLYLIKGFRLWIDCIYTQRELDKYKVTNVKTDAGIFSKMTTGAKNECYINRINKYSTQLNEASRKLKGYNNVNLIILILK